MNDYLEDNDELLDPESMLSFYAGGAFPMAEDKNGKIKWYVSKVRAIIPLDNYNYPRSLRKFLEKSCYTMKLDNDFCGVVNGCADRKETWITDNLINAYEKLFDLGYLHTVETYENDKLIGGLYGIAINGAFLGESMFSKKSQASKFALINLIDYLNKRKFELLDVQIMNEHLRMFGAIEVETNYYNRLLKKAINSNRSFYDKF